MHGQVVGVRREAPLGDEPLPVRQHRRQLVDPVVAVEQLGEVVVGARRGLVAAVLQGQRQAGPQQGQPLLVVQIGVGDAAVVQAERDQVRAAGPAGQLRPAAERRAAGGRPVGQREHRPVVGGRIGHRARVGHVPVTVVEQPQRLLGRLLGAGGVADHVPVPGQPHQRLTQRALVGQLPVQRDRALRLGQRLGVAVRVVELPGVLVDHPGQLGGRQPMGVPQRRREVRQRLPVRAGGHRLPAGPRRVPAHRGPVTGLGGVVHEPGQLGLRRPPQRGHRRRVQPAPA